jgi:hypothetical protein
MFNVSAELLHMFQVEGMSKEEMEGVKRGFREAAL